MKGREGKREGKRNTERKRQRQTQRQRQRQRKKEKSNHVLKVAIKCPYVLKHCATQEPTPAAENKQLAQSSDLQFS